MSTKRNYKNYVRKLGNQGSIAGLAIVILSAAIGGGLYLFKKQNVIQKKVTANIKRTRIIALEEKISRVAGYLIASNLIVCKQGVWSTNNPAKTCAWNEVNNGKLYKPEKFGLVEDSLTSKNYKKFIIENNTMFSKEEAGILSDSESTLLFKLKHESEISTDLGSSSIGANNDSDKYFVEVVGNLSYKENGKVKSKEFTSLYRRPIAVPDVKLVGDSACSERCIVSRSENPNPECRSEFFLDDKTPLQVNVEIHNLGPGPIYGTTFHRNVDYISGAVVKAAPSSNNKDVALSVGDYILSGETKSVSDEVTCATFNQTNINTVIVQNGHLESADSVLRKYVNFNFIKESLSLIVPRAYSQAAPTGGTVRRGRTTTTTTYVSAGSSAATQISQHTSPAGSINYNLSNVAGGNAIEPLRIIKPISSGNEAFNGGVQNTTTVTNVYRKIVRVHHSH